MASPLEALAAAAAGRLTPQPQDTSPSSSVALPPPVSATIPPPHTHHLPHTLPQDQKPYLQLHYPQVPIPFPHQQQRQYPVHHQHPATQLPPPNPHHPQLALHHLPLASATPFPPQYHQPTQVQHHSVDSEYPTYHPPYHSQLPEPPPPSQPSDTCAHPGRRRPASHPCPQAASGLFHSKKRRLPSSHPLQDQLPSSDIDSEEEDRIIDTVLDRMPPRDAHTETNTVIASLDTIQSDCSVDPNSRICTSAGTEKIDFTDGPSRVFSASPWKTNRGSTTVSSSTPWFRRPSIVWYRNHDLRLGDHPALQAVMRRKVPVVLVFVLDEWVETSDFDPEAALEGLPNVGDESPSSVSHERINAVYPQETPIIDVSRLGNVGHINDGDGPVTTFFAAEKTCTSPPGDPLALAWTLSSTSPIAWSRIDKEDEKKEKTNEKSILADTWAIFGVNGYNDTSIPGHETTCTDWSTKGAFLRPQRFPRTKLSNRQQQHLYTALDKLCLELRSHGASLVLRKTRGSGDEEILRLATDIKADAVYWNASRERGEMKKEARLKLALGSRAVQAHDYSIELVRDIDEYAKDCALLCFEKFKEAWFQCLESRLPDMPLPLPLGRIRCFASLVEPHKRLTLQSLGLTQETDLVSQKDRSSTCPADHAFEATSVRSIFWASNKTRNDPMLSSLVFRDFSVHFTKMKSGRGPSHIDLALDTCPPEEIVTPRQEKEQELVSQGRTGFPVLDAAMRHLNRFGYLPGWARTFVVHFAHCYLHRGWKVVLEEIQSRSAARLDEQTLLVRDCLASRSCNGRATTKFGAKSLVKVQAIALVRKMLPELRGVPDELVLQPWKLSMARRRSAGLRLVPGDGSPAIVESSESYLPFYPKGEIVYPKPFLTSREGGMRARKVDDLLNRVKVSYRVHRQLPNSEK